MRPQCLLLLLLIIPFASAGDCAGYIDRFDVKVVDYGLRPIEGAAVQVLFDRGASFGEQYFRTEPRYTGSDGKLHFDIYNQGTNVRDIDCEIYINATLGDIYWSTTVEENKHSDLIMVQLYVHPVTFRVADQYGQLLENATISLNEMTKDTDSGGKAKFFLGTGDYEYLVSYGDGKQSGNVYVSNDTFFDVTLGHSEIEIDIIDDFGAPLEATIFILNTTYHVTDGHFEYEEAFGDDIPYIITHMGIEKSGAIVPSEQRSIEVIFDKHAPVFGEISSTGDTEITRLVIPVWDNGDHASGVDYSSLKVSYRLEPAEAATPWNDAVTFVSALNTFMADFPGLPKNSIVQFKIEVKDNEGNKATVDGRFSPPLPEPEDNETGGNGGDSHQNGAGEQEIPFLYIVGGVFIVLLVIILVSRIKRD
ncbi:MAG: hypothetical protein ABII71_01185 [Candidatus Micrarchaeota archaeon]